MAHLVARVQATKARPSLETARGIREPWKETIVPSCAVIPWDLWMVFPLGLVTFFPLCDPSLWFQTLIPTYVWTQGVAWVALLFGIWCILAPYLFCRWVHAVSPF